MKNTQNDDSHQGYVVVGTKVSPNADKLLERLARKAGMTKYELMQMVVDTLIRYMDDHHNLTPEMAKVMAVFDDLHGWSDAFNLADPVVRREVGEAIYFLQDPKGERAGVRAMHVTKPYFGERHSTYNIQSVVERFLNLISPQRYMRMRRMATDMDCSSILELIDHLIDLHSEDANTIELRRLFEDCNRADYGRVYEYGKKTKSVHHKDIDNVKGLFEDEH